MIGMTEEKRSSSFQWYDEAKRFLYVGCLGDGLRLPENPGTKLKPTSRRGSIAAP